MSKIAHLPLISYTDNYPRPRWGKREFAVSKDKVQLIAQRQEFSGKLGRCTITFVRLLRLQKKRQHLFLGDCALLHEMCLDDTRQLHWNGFLWA